MKMRIAWRLGRRDPRLGQIGALSALLLFGLIVLEFNVQWWAWPCAALGCLSAEALGRVVQNRNFEPYSPLITSLSLTLLLRVGEPSIMLMAGAAAIGSKFLFRWGGRHFFNPANFGLVLVSLLFSNAWVSPGQWGALGLAAIIVAGIGAFVAGRASRLDGAAAFLFVWAALTFGRALYLGDPMAIPLHQIQSGALLVFAFFMISDPRTTPLQTAPRLAHALAVAVVGFGLQVFWLSDIGAIHALVILAPIIPILDTVFNSTRKETAPC